jgi:hypothetical protein
MKHLKLKIAFGFFFLSTFIILGQEKFIEGRVYISSLEKDNQLDFTKIEITNEKNKEKIYCDAKGNFRIKINQADTLIFSSAYTKTRYLKINKALLNKKEKIMIQLDLVGELPDEVIVHAWKYTNNLSSDLDKFFNQKYKMGFLSPSTSPSTQNFTSEVSFLNPVSILDFFSGKQKKQAQFQAYQISQNFIAQIREYYEDDFFIKELKLSKENISHYLEFVSKDKKAKDLYERKDFFMLKELLKAKAKVYLKSQKDSY